MGRASIPVDLFNPGQVFACLGFMEAAEAIIGATEAEFDWSSAESARFRLCVPGESTPIGVVLHFLANAAVRILAPRHHGFAASWDLELDEVSTGDYEFPQPAPKSPASLPAVLEHDGRRLTIDAWGDGTGRDNVKFWAGAQGKPGAAFVRDALDLVRDRIEGAVADPFDLSAPQSGSLRFDWRRDYVPLGIGFSINEHRGSNRIVPLGYPLVEVLAAIGITHARPQRPDPTNKFLYRYAVMNGGALPAVLHRAALGCAELPFPTRRFQMRLECPDRGQKMRCITSVTEELTR